MMNFKKYVWIMLVAGGVSFSACSESDDMSTSQVKVSLTLKDSSVSDYQLLEGVYTFKDVNTGVTTTFNFDDSKMILTDGLYNVSFEGRALFKHDDNEESPETPADAARTRAFNYEVALQGVQQNVEVKDGVCQLNMKIDVRNLNAKNNFVIAEVFAAGTLNPETSKSYNGDQYIRLYNNSSETLYADGLVLVESAPMTSFKLEYMPNIMDKAVTVQVVAMVPGSGKDHPVKPGESFVICDNAINHLEANPASADLSHADVEWFTNSTSTSIVDIDNPDVTNLDMIYNYTKTIWVLNKQGNKAYAICRFPEEVTKEKYLEEYTYKYKYKFANGRISREITSFFIPNSWVIDAVNLSPKNRHQWNVVDSSLDMGFAYLGENTSSAENNGKAVVRKVEKVVDGREVLQDTNNSTNDFNSSVRATLLAPAE